MSAKSFVMSHTVGSAQSLMPTLSLRGHELSAIRVANLTRNETDRWLRELATRSHP